MNDKNIIIKIIIINIKKHNYIIRINILTENLYIFNNYNIIILK